MKAIVVLFKDIEAAGAKNTEKFISPNLEKASITIKGSTNKIYKNGLLSRDMWQEAYRVFSKDRTNPIYNTPERFYSKDMFGFVVDFRSMRNENMHGSGVSIQNSPEGIQISIDWKILSDQNTGKMDYYVFSVNDAQINIANSTFLGLTK